MHRLSGCVLCSPTTAVHVTERKRADGAIMRRHTSQEYITDPVPYSSVQNPSDRDHGFISRISDLDTGTLRTGMHDTSVSDVKRHMSRIADYISWLCIRIGNLCSRTLQCPGSSWNRNAKGMINCLHKSGTVCAICQARSAWDIGIPYKLCGKTCHI